MWISDFGRKILLNFGEDLFFVEITCFWAEKLFEFPISAENSVSISDKPCESDQEQWKFWSRSLTVVSLFQKSPPFFKFWLRAWSAYRTLINALWAQHGRTATCYATFIARKIGKFAPNALPLPAKIPESYKNLEVSLPIVNPFCCTNLTSNTLHGMCIILVNKLSIRRKLICNGTYS